jgi:hypothetical protein
VSGDVTRQTGQKASKMWNYFLLGPLCRVCKNNATIEKHPLRFPSAAFPEADPKNRPVISLCPAVFPSVPGQPTISVANLTLHVKILGSVVGV